MGVVAGRLVGDDDMIDLCVRLWVWVDVWEELGVEDQPDHLAGAFEEVVDVGEAVGAKNGGILFVVDGSLQPQGRNRLRRGDGGANCVRRRGRDYSRNRDAARSACPSGSRCRRFRRRE